MTERMIGRKDEIRQLQEALNIAGSAIMVYGKRKVGKTTLIKHVVAARPEKFIYYECVRGTLQDNLRSLCGELSRQGVMPAGAAMEDIRDVFRWLSASDVPLTIVVDEYPYLKVMEKADYIDSLFQSVIDQYLGKNRLILSGSHIGMMKDMLSEGNALYGRFQTVLHLRELDYRVASDFYPALSAYDKIGFFAVFGGSPYVLSFLNPEKSLAENIQVMMLNENHPVFLYLEKLLLSDMGISTQMERILAALKNGKKHFSEIERITDPGRSGNLTKYIKVLQRLEIVSKNIPINEEGNSKKATYEINDNPLRFYYTYIRDRKSALMMLGAEAFYREYIHPTLRDFIARRFEEVCRAYFSLQAKAGKLPGLRGIGTFYYDDPVNRKNGEFEVALQFQASWQIWEAKYMKNPLTLDEIHREVAQIRAIPLSHVEKIGFIAASGFAHPEDGLLFLTGKELYEANP